MRYETKLMPDTLYKPVRGPAELFRGRGFAFAGRIGRIDAKRCILI